MTDHRRLLADYASTGSESAFREVVSLYINMVYSTARRLVGGDAHAAEDVTQMVFADLARLAKTLPAEVLISGWLHRRACHVAATLMRGERRRRNRERWAAEMSTPHSNEQDGMQQIAPMLDEAINQLSDDDRAAIVMRYFEHRDLRTIGEILGSNEDAAQKRISRAVEKLRGYFARRGVTASASAIGAALALSVAESAPAGLIATITAVSLAGAASAGSAGALSTFIGAIAMKKITTIVLLVIMLGSAIAVPAIVARMRLAKSQTQGTLPATPLSEGAATTRGAPVEIVLADIPDLDPPVTMESLRKGLVLHFSFDIAESGGKVTDSSGAGNNGQLTGAQWTSEGRRGGAFTFAPPNQYIRIPNSPSLNPAQITLAAWVKTSRTDDTWRRIFDKNWKEGYAMSIGGGFVPGQEYHGKGVVELGMSHNSSKGMVFTNQPIADGQWHHVVVTYNGSEEYFYLDGAQQRRIARWAGEVPANNLDLIIGLNLVDPNPKYNEVGESFDGSIDEPMIFSRALSAKEVTFLYDSQRQ